MSSTGNRVSLWRGRAHEDGEVTEAYPLIWSLGGSLSQPFPPRQPVLRRYEVLRGSTGPAAHAQLHEEEQRFVPTGPCSAAPCSAERRTFVQLSSPAARGDRRWPLANVSHGRDTGTVPRRRHQQHVPLRAPPHAPSSLHRCSLFPPSGRQGHGSWAGSA